jgi:predicted HAD superfamily hydrolase/GT2 family glycosyltransferase
MYDGLIPGCFMNKKINELSEIISPRYDGYKVYSFDIFDTLLSRCLPPEYVKILTSQYMINKYSERLSAFNCYEIYNTRKQIESLLEDRNVEQGYDRDYSFDECIRLLVRKLFDDDDSEISQDIASLEISLEIAVARVNKEAITLLEILKKRGNRIICISDMYLGGTIISEILRAKGLLYYIDAIYVSSDLKKRKDTGNIFPIIIEKEGIGPSEMLHIGDNEQTDCTIPAQYGIDAIHFSSLAEHGRYALIDRVLKDGNVYSNRMKSLVRALVADFTYSGSCRHGGFFETLAYPFISYIHALIDFCREKNINKVYFLSREGLFFKNLFGIINDAVKADIQTEYLLVSRKSLIVPSIPELTDDAIEKILNYYDKHYFKKVASISQILNMLMIDNDDVRGICHSTYRINPDTTLLISEFKEVVRSILPDPRIRSIYGEKHREYTAIFLKYCASLGMRDEGRIVFSDMGWSGSMQTYLQQLLNRYDYNTEIYGYYFGYDETIDLMKHKDMRGNKSGFFQNSKEPSLTDSRIHSIINNITLELIATAEHGTVLSYRVKGDSVEPVYAENGEEAQQYNHFSRIIQEHICRYAHTYNSLLLTMKVLFSPQERYEFVTGECYDFFENPDLQSAETVSRLLMIDDFFGNKQVLRFRQSSWWAGASNVLRESRGPVRKTIDRIARLAWNTYTYTIKLNLYYGRVYGFSDYVKTRLHKVIGKIELNDRKLNLIKTYRFVKEPNVDRPISNSYIFIACFDPGSKKRTDMLIKNITGQKLGKISAIIFHGGNCTLIDIGHENQVRKEILSLKRALRLVSAKNYLVTINCDVLLDESFMARVDERLNACHADALYCDNDTIYKNTYFTNPKFKPCWSKFAYFEQDYIGPVIVIRVDRLIENFNHFMQSYEKWGSRGAVISVLENLKSIEHIPIVLYHDYKYDRESSCKPVNEYFHRNGIPAHADQKSRYFSRVTFQKTEEKLITVIIPFKDKSDYLQKCVESIIKKTDYSNYEIMLVNNESTEQKTTAYLKSLTDNKKIKIIDYNYIFNYSALNNYAVDRSGGEYVVFLNNDTETLRADWLDRMMDYASLPSVGCVGAKLLYPDGRIQHGGVIFNFNYEYPATNQFSLESKYSRGYLNRLLTVQNYSAVAAACMMMRKDIFHEIGGFDESFKVAYNDLDLCCKLLRAGYEIIWNPHVEIIHHEYISRGHPQSSKTDIIERDMFIERWKDMFTFGDPYHTPALDLFGNILG